MIRVVCEGVRRFLGTQRDARPVKNVLLKRKNTRTSDIGKQQWREKGPPTVRESAREKRDVT